MWILFKTNSIVRAPYSSSIKIDTVSREAIKLGRIDTVSREAIKLDEAQIITQARQKWFNRKSSVM